jgi:hypothetical protein
MMFGEINCCAGVECDVRVSGGFRPRTITSPFAFQLPGRPALSALIEKAPFGGTIRFGQSR